MSTFLLILSNLFGITSDVLYWLARKADKAAEGIFNVRDRHFGLTKAQVRQLIEALNKMDARVVHVTNVEEKGAVHDQVSIRSPSGT